MIYLLVPSRQTQPQTDINRIRRDHAEEEALTGMVHGMDASAPEERIARAADKHPSCTGYEFRRVYNRPQRNMPGAIELDFLFHIGIPHPVQVDEEYFHSGAVARAADRQRDRILYENFLRYKGSRLISRVRADFLETQEQADNVFEQIVAGRIFSIDDVA